MRNKFIALAAVITLGTAAMAGSAVAAPHDGGGRGGSSHAAMGHGGIGHPGPAHFGHPGRYIAAGHPGRWDDRYAWRRGPGYGGLYLYGGGAPYYGYCGGFPFDLINCGF